VPSSSRSSDIVTPRDDDITPEQWNAHYHEINFPSGHAWFGWRAFLLMQVPAVNIVWLLSNMCASSRDTRARNKVSLDHPNYTKTIA
jgi:hypothetical protein